MVITLWIIVTLTFVLMISIPGSPFNTEANTNKVVQENMEKHYGLDKPAIVQYANYMKSVVTLDFGPSIRKPSQSVNELLARGFPISFELGMIAIIVAVFSGILLGIAAALKHSGFIDYLAMTIAVLGISIPNFILATLLIQQLAINVEVFPVARWTDRKSVV